MSEKRSPQEQDKYVVRFPDGMRDRLKAVAEQNNRSLNAEIIARLDVSLGAGPSDEQLDLAELSHLREAVRRQAKEQADQAERVLAMVEGHSEIIRQQNALIHQLIERTDAKLYPVATPVDGNK